MDTRLKDALWEGEEVRWSGRPKPFALMDRLIRPSILMTWAVSGLILVLTTVLLGLSVVRGARSLTDALVLAAVVLFLPVILSVRPFLDRRCLEDRTVYAITNFRIIAVIKDEVMYLTLRKGMSVSVDSQGDGCGNLRFGDTVGKPAKKARVHAVLGIRDDELRNNVLGLLFYHVDQPEQLLGYLS